MTDIKIISLRELFGESFDYMLVNWRNMAIFSIVHMLFGVAGFFWINGWRNVFFLPWLVTYYLFWCFFFRFYFKRKPYLMTVKLFYTLVPSTRMLAMTFVVVTALLFLPMLPLFFGIGSEWAYTYNDYLQRYMEDSRVVDMVTWGIIILTAPLVFFRPMMAWISSLIGRSGSMKSAFLKTRGNYWKMAFLMALFQSLIAGLEFGGRLLGLGSSLLIVVGSVLVIYLNVILAKTYDYFFLEIEA